MSPELSVIVPAYNEEGRLPSTLARIRQYLDGRQIDYEVIVVDDGSRDATLPLAEQLQGSFSRLRVLANGRNRGKGFSVRQGFLKSRGSLVLFSDADLSAPIEEMEKLERALAGNDGAIGSRALAGSNIIRRQSLFRELSGKCFNLLMRLTVGLRFRDTQCGFKLFRRASFLPIFQMQSLEGFAFDVEILYLAQKGGLKVVEVPVCWGHAEGSRVRFFPDAFRMMGELLKIRLRHG